MCKLHIEELRVGESVKVGCGSSRPFSVGGQARLSLTLGAADRTSLIGLDTKGALARRELVRIVRSCVKGKRGRDERVPPTS